MRKKYAKVLDWFVHLTQRCSTSENGCWIWTFGRTFGRGDKVGYGVVNYEGKPVKAHRLMFMLANPGVSITDLQINHKCDNSLCINPAHLYVGTHADNMRDKSLRGRVFRPIGETNPRARFKPDQIAKIREQVTAGKTCAAIAIEYNVDASTITKIIKRKTWAHVA